MPDERRPEGEKANIVGVLLKDKLHKKDIARFGQVVETVRQQNLAAIDSVGAALATIDLSTYRLATKVVVPPIPRFDALISANIAEVPVFHPSNLIDTARMSEITSSFAESHSALKDLAAVVSEQLSWIKPRIRELLRSIQFAFPSPDPRLSDVISAIGKDPGAAARVASRIDWRPNRWQWDCIRIKSRAEGDSPEEVRKNALVQGVLLALSGEKDDEVPILIRPESTWLYDDEQNLATIAPFQQLPIDYFWSWLGEEAARAAGLWLVGFPYAPSVVLEVPPDGISDWQFAKFTSLATNEQSLNPLRGRPSGSGIFENEDAFVVEIRLAVDQVKNRGHRLTQERVAESMSQRGLLGSGSPERQLRRWVNRFGYVDWRDLLSSL